MGVDPVRVKARRLWGRRYTALGFDHGRARPHRYASLSSGSGGAGDRASGWDSTQTQYSWKRLLVVHGFHYYRSAKTALQPLKHYLCTRPWAPVNLIVLF
jgi:hypothetical protein